MFKRKKPENLSSREIIIIAVILLITVIAFLRSGTGSIVTEDGTIMREDYTGKDLSVSLVADIEDVGSAEYGIDVSKRQLSYEELEKIYDEFYPVLINTVLNGNKSSDMITGDLCFPDSIEGYPFEISFSCKDRDCISCGKQWTTIWSLYIISITTITRARVANTRNNGLAER